MVVLLHRLLIALPTLLLLPLIVFLLLELAPGDATQTLLDVSASDEAVQQMRTELGLDCPLLERYGRYLEQLAQGNLGLSGRSGTSVSGEIALRLPYTLALMGAAVTLAFVIGCFLGVISAFKRGTVWDMLITALVSVATAVPTFWLALLLISFFAVRMRWLPVFGADGLAYLVLPTICTAFALIPGITRITRVSVLETLRSDFVMTARAKGLSPPQILWRHIGPIAAVPVITYLGTQMANLFTSVVVVEVIFNWPGIGGLAVNAAFDRDPLVLQGTTLTIAALTFVILLIADLLVLYLDPRVTE